MPETKQCAECGAALAAFWPRGLCAQCALAGALDLTHGASHFPPLDASTSPGGTQTPPGADCSPLGSFGEYDLLEEIARGGMGVVYKARQRKLDRIVAVKMILAGPLAGKEFVQRFRTEASAAAILQHPNIVAIHDVGVHEGRHYFSMDYVEGQNLARLVGQQALPAARSARYVQLIAEAIHYAHERGILHRDLKPSNVLIDSTDQPRVTDFGLAKRFGTPVAGGSGAGEAGPPSWELTVTGQVLGSPSFMPPEQAGAKRGKVGRASDVYALGGILYYLLTARPPFHADSLEHLIGQVLNAEPVAPSLLNPSVPRDLEVIALKCLEKEPARRYQTAREVADELGRVLRQEPIRARPVSAPEKLWRWCRRKPALAAALGFALLALVAGLATTSWQWRRAEHQRAAAGHLLYVANMNLLQAAWEQNHISRARQLLHETATEPQRGFEWYFWQRQMQLELQALRGHAAPILALACSADGRRIVTGSADQTVRLWDSDRGNEILRLIGHRAPVSSVAFCPSGERIVSSSWDKTAKMWDATEGGSLVDFVGHDGAVFAVAVSPDGQRIVTGSQDKTVRVWDAHSGRELLRLRGHSEHVLTVAFSPDGRRIVSGSWDKTAKVWDAASGEELRSVIGHSGPIFSVAVSPDGQRLLTGSQDSGVHIWDPLNGAKLFTLKGHRAAVFSVGFARDGTRILTSGEDQTARVWNAITGEEIHVLKGHGSRIGSAALSPDSQRIVTGGGAVQFDPIGRVFGAIGEDAAAKVWNLADIGEGSILEGHEASVSSVEFSPDGRRVASGGFDGTARLWDVGSRSELLRITGHQAAIRSIAFFPDGRRLVTGSFDRTAKVWELATGKELLTLAGHTAQVFSVAVSPDGRTIATGGWDRTVKMWDASTGANLRTLPNAGGAVYAVGFSPNGDQIVSASAPSDEGPGTIAGWAVSDGRELWSFQNSGKKIWSAVFSGDGRRILSGGHDLTANVWDPLTGKEQLALEGHTAHIHAAVYSPDGRRILTGSADRTAKLWDAATGKELLTLRGHSGWIFSVAFSRDGRRIATGSRDHTVRVWEAATREQSARWLQQHPGAAASMTAPTGSR